jgi:hypothetical protein
MVSNQGLQILQEHAPKSHDYCQCGKSDIIIEGKAVWCAICGADIRFPEAALALYDPLTDVADARREARFGKGL